jgi:hypothetical protein
VSICHWQQLLLRSLFGDCRRKRENKKTKATKMVEKKNVLVMNTEMSFLQNWCLMTVPFLKTLLECQSAILIIFCNLLHRLFQNKIPIIATVFQQILDWFLATGDSYHSLMYPFKATSSAISLITPEVCRALIETLQDYIKVRKHLFY